MVNTENLSPVGALIWENRTKNRMRFLSFRCVFPSWLVLCGNSPWVIPFGWWCILLGGLIIESGTFHVKFVIWICFYQSEGKLGLTTPVCGFVVIQYSIWHDSAVV